VFERMPYPVHPRWQFLQQLEYELLQLIGGANR
jgi:hypothetical protein